MGRIGITTVGMVGHSLNLEPKATLALKSPTKIDGGRSAPVAETRPTPLGASLRQYYLVHLRPARHFGVGEMHLLTDTTKHTHYASEFPLQMSKRFRKATRYTRTSRYSRPVRRTRRYQPKATARMASV